MDYIMLALTAIGTIATIISTIIAVRAKNETKRIVNKIKIVNEGINKGNIVGINKGDIK
jgi:predicted membrane protein